MGLFDETDLAKKKEEQKKKNKKMLVLIGIGLFILLVALVVVLYFIINPPGEPELRVWYYHYDGTKEVTKDLTTTMSKYLKVDKVNKTIESFSIRDMASLFNYSEKLGSYTDIYNEEIDNECYVEKKGVEVTMFKQGSSKVTKHSLLANIPDQIFELSEMVDETDKNFYISEEGVELTFNCQVTYNTKQNIISIQSLEYIVNSYKSKCPLIKAPTGTEKEFSYTDFCNQKAILNGYFVIMDPSSDTLGLIKKSSLDTKVGSATYLAPLAKKKNVDIEISNILTLKTNYKQIQFQESNNYFIVTTKSGDVGIYNGDGERIVEPAYKSITEIKKQGNTYLYAVKNSENKWGVVNSNDKVVIKIIYDQIGIDSDMKDSNVKNRYILYDTFIPAKYEGEWVFFNLSGTPDLENIEFADQCFKEGGITNIGCKVDNESKAKSTLVMVPYEDVDGLIVEYDYTDPTTKKQSKRYAVLSTARYKIEIYDGLGAYKKVDVDGNEIYMLSDKTGDVNIANYIKFDNDRYEDSSTDTEEDEEGDDEEEDTEDEEDIDEEEDENLE